MTPYFYTPRNGTVGTVDTATHLRAARMRAEILRELLEDEEDPFAEDAFPVAVALDLA